MDTEQQQLLTDVLGIMSQLAADWEYSGTLDENTYLVRDLGLQSLDLVILGTSLQQRYGRLPFAEFLAEIGSRPLGGRDVSVGELVAFVGKHREPTSSSEPR